MSRRVAAAATQRGLTLLELVITLAVLALLASTAGPSFGALVARHRLRAVAEHLAADLAEAREEAARRGTPVHASFESGEHWCYAITLAADAPCTGAAGDAALKVVRAQDHPGIVLVEAANLAFDARDGSSLQDSLGHARFASPAGDQLQVQLSRLGRARVCVPDPARPAASDLPRC